LSKQVKKLSKRLSKTKDVFNSLKKGSKIHDTWYGNGVVVKTLKTRIHIKLYSSDEIYSYDKAHVNGFIKLGYYRPSK
jgi:hypothetical protein